MQIWNTSSRSDVTSCPDPGPVLRGGRERGNSCRIAKIFSIAIIFFTEVISKTGRFIFIEKIWGVSYTLTTLCKKYFKGAYELERFSLECRN